MRLQIDKAGWGEGPWLSEPDFERLELNGFHCIIRRVPGPGHLCGYLAVPPGHPWHGKSLDALPDELSVHGGITYAEPCEGEICHIPKPGESDNVWWLGFDCSHARDMRPGEASMLPADVRKQRDLLFASHGVPHPEAYRTADYVRAELARLAGQAGNAGPPR